MNKEDINDLKKGIGAFLLYAVSVLVIPLGIYIIENFDPLWAAAMIAILGAFVQYVASNIVRTIFGLSKEAVDKILGKNQSDLPYIDDKKKSNGIIKAPQNDNNEDYQ